MVVSVSVGDLYRENLLNSIALITFKIHYCLRATLITSFECVSNMLYVIVIIIHLSI